MMLARTLTLVLAALLWGAVGMSPLMAQSAVDRAALDAFRDSLVVIMDPVPLQQLEGELMRAAKERPNNPLLHLRQGFLSLRLGDLGLLRHYDDAASEFQWAVELQPDWPYGWFALGLAEYELGKVQGPGSRRATMLGRDASTRAATAWMRAALADPGFAARLEVLAAQAVRRRDAERAGVVLLALREAVASQPAGKRSPALLLAAGRVEREVGDLPAALNAFETYRRLGDNRALGLLEVARTRFLLGQLEGTESYYDGAAMDDLVALAGYRADLEVVASDSVMARFDALRGQARADLLALFWGSRDRLDFRPAGSRLREHYRRLAYARRNYSAGGWSLPSDPAFLRNEAVLDDRGRLHVRHGEPDAKVALNSLGVEPNESWSYRRESGDLVFHFVARQDPDRYRLVESLLDVVDMRSNVAFASAGQGDDGAIRTGASDQLLRSREGFATVYAEFETGRSEGNGRVAARERALVQSSLHAGLSTDSYEPRFARDLAARLVAVTTNLEDGTAVAHLQVAVPGFGLEPWEIEGRIHYPMRLRLVAVDPTGAVRVEVDTVLAQDFERPIRPDRYLEDVVTVPVPANVTLTYRMALFVGQQSGTASALDTMVTLPAAAPDLRLGDLVLGAADHGLTAGSVALLPMQGLSRSTRLVVRAELVGVAGEGKWRATFTLRDPDTGRAVFTESFDGRVEGGRGVVERTIAIRRVSPGRYLAELEVTDAARGVAIQRQRLVVTAP
ncbi:MAG: hypothetical protein SGI84_11770 [Gemmatimonadota bacterium]|nr:hypothetical protein [Gemmatimonadota bacterium]